MHGRKTSIGHGAHSHDWDCGKRPQIHQSHTLSPMDGGGAGGVQPPVTHSHRTTRFLAAIQQVGNSFNIVLIKF